MGREDFEGRKGSAIQGPEVRQVFGGRQTGDQVGNQWILPQLLFQGNFQQTLLQIGLLNLNYLHCNKIVEGSRVF